jgi:hypothetical protein
MKCFFCKWMKKDCPVCEGKEQLSFFRFLILKIRFIFIFIFVFIKRILKGKKNEKLFK